jgi:LacI family transcriptional regulator
VAATIQDVARKAGVSIATVSNVLNAPERVREATRTRVLEAIDALGFVPRAEAVARARRHLGRIGVVAPFTSYTSYTERLQGILRALRARDFDLVVYDQESVAVRRDLLSTLPITHHLDGLIVMLPIDERIAHRLATRGLETVLVEFPRPGFSAVHIDDEAGGHLAATHLMAKGHRRLAFVGERQVERFIIAQTEHRLNGFRRALDDAGFELPEQYVSLAPFGVGEAMSQTFDLLDLREPPTAIFAHSDSQAVGVLKAAHRRGLRVPDDLAVIGFDDLEMADHLGLTTIHQPLAESGRVALDLLLERLTDASRPVRSVKLPVHLVERDTA